MKIVPRYACLALIMVLLPSLPIWAGENMIGRQSQNEGLPLLPVPGAVSIDGNLDDWDFSGRIWIFAEQSVRNRYSAEVGGMWDKEYLYIAAKWRDPSPMHNTIDPDFNPSSGWKSDSIQMRVRTEDQISWLTTWYFTPRQQPVFHLAVWEDMRNHRSGIAEQLFVAEAGGTVLGSGIEMAYRQNEEGDGFVQEIRIPWALLFRAEPRLEAGAVVRIGFEFLWGDPTGNTWPTHRYADNMQPGATSREFFWSAWKSWGDATLLAKGNVEPRRYISDAARIDGSIPIRVELPKSAARFTLAIEGADGSRVRNLAGDLMPEDYLVEERDTTRVVEVKWDGLDESGQLVAPGSYQVRGLYHDGLGAEYEMTFYNPGTPPWPISDGSGAWGADHVPPLRVAAAGDWMIASWSFAEGGSGIIGVDPNGFKKWGEKRGATLLAADDQFVYGTPASWHIKHDVLIRLASADGAYRPFTLNGKERPFELPLADIVGSADWKPVDMVATRSHLIVLLAPVDEAGTQSRIVWLDKESAEMRRSLDLPLMTTIAAGSNGELFAHDGKRVVSIGQNGALTTLTPVGLEAPGPMTLDGAGRLLIMDQGSDLQVKAFNSDGTLAYTCGKKGGRPLRGTFDTAGMRDVSSIAVDSKGEVWVVESSNYPRRISVWNPTDGSLVRHYVGTTAYAGSGSYLHDSNPDLAYVGPIEMKLNKAERSWDVTRVLWVPDKAAGETFEIDPGHHAQCQRFTATVNGQAREYLYSPPYRDYSGHTIYMETAAGWQPVSAIVSVGAMCNALDGHANLKGELWPEFADCHPFDAVFWNDGNGDGKPQRAECEVVKWDGERGKRDQRSLPIPMGSGWGQRITTDFVFYVNGLARYTPLRFTAEGAPVYGPDSLQRLDIDDRGDLIPVPEEELLLCLSWKGYAGPTGLYGYEPETGKTRWKYANPYPGVHGSHRATMPAPGLLIGPLKIAGVARINDEIGRVFLMRGNLGQDFLMTTDGLFVGSMFEDGRLPGESLPDTEAALIGRPMESFSNGGEPFNGWFGKQADGKIRLTNGFPRQAAMILTVNGLESIRRFALGEIQLTAEELTAADADNQARAIADAPPREYTVQTFDVPLRLTGSNRGWEGVPEVVIERSGFPLKGKARLGLDAENLYLLYEIEDDSPWINEGKDYSRLFKTGDAVDLQLGVDPEAKADRRNPVRGDLRLVIGKLDGKPVVVLMKPVDPDASAELALDYSSPVAPKHFDRVEILGAAQVKVTAGATSYTVEAAVPLAALGLQPVSGMRLGVDFGFISSDKSGSINTARTYWSNKDTNLVNDLPQEAWFSPAKWGTLIVP